MITNRKKELYVSESAHKELRKYLENKGYKIAVVANKGFVHPAICSHPDIYYCRMGAVDSAPVIGTGSLSDAITAGDNEAASDEEVSYLQYPDDCRYNAACTGRYLIHRLDITAPEILEYARGRGMQLIQVPQGYAKCSIVVVDETSIITYDRGIEGACRKQAPGLQVLTVEPAHVYLPGMITRSNENCPGIITQSNENCPGMTAPGQTTSGRATAAVTIPEEEGTEAGRDAGRDAGGDVGKDAGFIGGTSGRVGDEVLFNGDLSAHPNFPAIRDFIEARGLTCKWFPGLPLIDIGSIV